jgi:hypothetical protein
MAKGKLFGVLESTTVLLEPIGEKRYHLEGARVEPALINAWVTVAGDIMGDTIANAEIVNVEKNSGRVTRQGVIVADAPNKPPEATGQGGYLYQAGKGRYILLSAGPTDQPVQGDFGAYVDRNVRVSGTYGSARYILYNVRVTLL